MNDQEIKNRLKQVIPFDESAKTVNFAKSHGSFLVDADNKEYLDLCSSFGSMPLGYNHHKLYERMMPYKELFINKISNSDLYSEIYVNFINKLFENLPKRFTKGFFIDNGSSAVDCCLKACFDFHAKKYNLTEEQVNNLDVIGFLGCFHGRIGYPVSLTSTDPNKTKLYPKHNFTKILIPEVKFPINNNELQLLEDQSLMELETALRKKNISSVIMEPLVSEGGGKIIRQEYFQEVRKLTKSYNTFLVIDEIQSGLGLSGHMWLSEYYEVNADMLCLGKKLQISGFVSTDKINKIKNNVFNERSRISSTFGGSTTDMLRATIIFDIIHEENLLDNVRTQGEYLLAELHNISNKYPFISNVRGIGLLIAFSLPNQDTRDKLLLKLNEKMFILPCGNDSIRLRPYLNVSRGECNLFLNILEDTLKNHEN